MGMELCFSDAEVQHQFLHGDFQSIRHRLEEGGKFGFFRIDFDLHTSKFLPVLFDFDCDNHDYLQSLPANKNWFAQISGCILNFKSRLDARHSTGIHPARMDI
jgi:hypothetical protein